MKADTIHYYEIRPRRDKRGFDLISEALPFGRLWYQDADAAVGYGSRRPFAFPEIHKSIQKRFGAKTFFVLLGRFDEVAAYLHERIDNTILARNNRSRGTRSYKSFAEYETEQMNAANVR